MVFNTKAYWQHWGLFLMLACGQVSGDQSVSTGPYDIHYTAFSSMLVPADTASMLGITRAENRILINISVREGDKPAAVDVQGHALTVLNQTQQLKFSQVTEQTAIYYLAELINHERDWLRFSININFHSDHPPYVLEFSRQYY
ncbi:MAG: DUF4426 domain-containing protein [Pseudomonadales bacterium]